MLEARRLARPRRHPFRSGALGERWWNAVSAEESGDRETRGDELDSLLASDSYLLHSCSTPVCSSVSAFFYNALRCRHICLSLSPDGLRALGHLASSCPGSCAPSYRALSQVFVRCTCDRQCGSIPHLVPEDGASSVWERIKRGTFCSLPCVTAFDALRREEGC